MSALTIIFITVIICAELDFFAVLYCKEISEWLNAKSEEIRARAENLKNANPAYNSGYSSGYTDGKIDGMKAFARGAENLRKANPAYSQVYSTGYASVEFDGMKSIAHDDSEPDTEIFRREGSE